MGDFQRLRVLFERCADLPPADRARLLDDECESDSALRSDVEALLRGNDRPGPLFDTAEEAPGAFLPPARQPGLEAGTRLGPYEIVAPLGAGGMGDVYRARDVRLRRTVALKVLALSLSHDPSAVQRFEREARVIASLSHPHICPVYDAGKDGEVHFLVMECLEGETLATRLSKGSMPAAEACRYGAQIAHALAAAHRAGIVHRDLKPGNVMVTPQGLRLLDFGLSKMRAASPAAPPDADAPAPITRQGLLLGTFQYMAPEQLDGSDIDQRTDVFAFGVVLYEMFTGQRPFTGSDAVLAGRILHVTPPPPSSFDPAIPQAVDTLVMACMAKDPGDRPHDLDDIALRLLQLSEAPRRRGLQYTLGSGAALVAALLVAALAGEAWREAGPASGRRPPGVSPTSDRKLTRLTFESGVQTDPAFSPDGRFLAYAGDGAGSFDIWIQPLAGGNPLRLTDSPGQETEPAWSPDGTSIAFRSEGEDAGIYVIPARGGPARQVSPVGAVPLWSADGSRILFLQGGLLDVMGGTPTGLYAVPARGGQAVQVQPEFSRSGTWLWIAPHPDGRVSYFGRRGGGETEFYTVSAAGVVTQSRLEAGAHLLRLSNDRQRFRWGPDGSTLFIESYAGNVRNIWKVRVNRTTLAWDAAEPVTLGTDTAVAASVSADGSRIAFSSRQETEQLWSFPFASEGAALGTGRAVSEPGAAAGQLRASRDGSSVLYTLSRQGSGAGDGWTNNGGGLWLAPLEPGGSAPRLLAPDGENGVWSRDGRRVAYLRVRPQSTDRATGLPVSALAIRRLDGAEELVSPWDSKRMLLPVDWSADDRALLVSAMDGQTVHFAHWPVAAGSGSPRMVLSAARAALWEGQYSPDGRWLAFVHISASGAAINVIRAGHASSDGWTRMSPPRKWADKPRWSSDGRSLYFLLRERGFLNLWVVGFDPYRGTPEGPPLQVTHFESPRLMVSSRMDFMGMAIAPRWVAMTMRTTEGHIWMVDNVNR